jgi:hypothetical protein
VTVDHPADHPADHPPPELLDRFLAAAVSSAESRWALAHLLARCAVCTRHLRRAVAAADPARPGPSPYDVAITTALRRSAASLQALDAERLQATALWATLEGTPPSQRLRRIAGDPRYHTWPLASRLLDLAAERSWQDAPAGIDACRLALAIAERLPAAAPPAGSSHDLCGRALASLADSLRLDGQLDAARATLVQARQALALGSGDPPERAALLRVQAGLELAAGDPAAAVALLRAAAGIYRRFGDRHQLGRTLHQQARAVGFDDPARGAALARRALALIEPAREPRLDLAARHGLVWFLNDSGSGAQALDELECARPLYALWRDSEPRLLLPWLEARICRRLGELAAAERGLAAVWHDFHDSNFPRELTLVSLDLAEAYLAQRKTRHAVRLLKTFQGFLRHFQMHAPGMAAWLLLIDAAAGEAATAQALTRQAGLYFRRAWRRPLPFAPRAA